MLNANKVSLHNRSEIVNPEMHKVLLTQGRHPKELYDDYPLALAKQVAQGGGRFDLSINESHRAAEISIKQRKESS